MRVLFVGSLKRSPTPASRPNSKSDMMVNLEAELPQPRLDCPASQSVETRPEPIVVSSSHDIDVGKPALSVVEECLFVLGQAA
jgi:hypothetical protein